ncbi:UNVERIFIED_CONTAM: hypothetical protein GTU68_003176 [Idotea baltica]|nr:hypothetical protein [Idotea baltica]
MSEFDLIADYFTWDAPQTYSKQNNSNEVIKSVGDDAAVLSLAPHQQLVTSIDTLISGVHFPENTSAADIAYKALAVNLSDLAAMGAKPEWFTLALTVPNIQHDWLAEFSNSLKTLAKNVGIALVGGDTTKGHLSISIQVMGSVDSGKALFRDGASINDKIYVTGSLGDGVVGLLSRLNKLKLDNESANYCETRLNRPTARLNESELIKDLASSCIDISDGLLQDLSHILKQSSLPNEQSKVGATLDLTQLPLSKALKAINKKQAINYALSGGDDYELLFTIPEDNVEELIERNRTHQYEFTCIGTITNKQGIIDNNHNPLKTTGFDHFS